MQCILGTPYALTMAVGALNVVLLFSLVTGLSGLPTALEKEVENRSLPTELQPPPLDEKEHHATVFIINLYALNSSSNESEQVLKNEIVETVPDLLEPLATVLLVVENDEDEKEHLPVDLDEFAVGLKDQGYKVDKIDHNGKTKVLRMKVKKEEAQSMEESASKSDDETKPRQKRTICFSCGGGGGGGRKRWGGGGGRGGGNCGRGCGGGGGRGGGGSWSSSSASAHSSSGSWGK
ncbi:forkhead box protein D1-like isoform X5 [Odontomachus brunneus]|uniref:forkhead box protein D1-like isoform X5 n=1 Tax=Odontomachus brunneus TaxID=486640 RepID=UPI0013F297FD|nr:forkhead box protein D1-like isoform X5 [Odontomachus brunneus]